MSVILTDEEKAILNGEQGEAKKFAMEILQTVADGCGAKRLIPIQSVHLVIHTYKSCFDAGVEAAEKIAAMGAKFSVPTTIDPYGMDAEDWKAAKTPEQYATMQKRLAKAIESMGVIPYWTCTPYYGFTVPKFGEHLAWTESSAVAFANTVLGARSNRETAIVDLCCAILGKTVETGLHLTENRYGQVLINLNIDRPLKQWEYGALGFRVGRLLGNKIGVVNGVKGTPTTENLKTLCAAGAAQGSLALLHIVGITPEARTLEDAFGPNTPIETIDIGEAELLETRAAMNTHKGTDIDLIALGCPQYTINEIVAVRDMLKGRHIAPNLQFWIYANSFAIQMAEKMGVRKELEDAGVTIRAETCMIISPIHEWNFKTIMTDSGKCVHYGPMECNAEMLFGSTEECVEAGVAGHMI